MKYKVKNTVTGEETICEKVVVGGFEYYIGEEMSKHNDYCFYSKDTKNPIKYQRGEYLNSPKVIATTNKSLDLPRVVDEVNWSQYSREEHKKNHPWVQEMGFALGIMVGYDKAKETYSYTKDDLINFKQQAPLILEQLNGASDSELFDLWQEQRTIEILVK